MTAELTLRRTASKYIPGWERDKFWDVLHRGLSVGSIIEKAGPADAPISWTWTLIIHAPGLRATDGRETTKEAAMAAFREGFDRRIEEIGEAGWDQHVQHMAWLEERSGPSRY